MTAAVLRYLRLAVAYALSAGVAGLLIGVLFALAGEGVADAPWFVLAAFAALFMAIWAALPAHAIILIAEWRAIRSPWLYVGFAMLVGGTTGAVLRLTPWMPWAGLGIGIATGLTFWAVAGRSAGDLIAKGKAGTFLLLLLAASALATAAVTWLYAL